MRILVALLLLMVALPAGARQPASPRSAILAVLADSAKGWNQGNVDRFLGAYSNDPATSFTGSRRSAHGKTGIRASYLASYKDQFGGGATNRSTLRLDPEDFRPLGTGHALLIARWTLVTPGKAEPETGMTSLVFRKEKAGWRIIADHSS